MQIGPIELPEKPLFLAPMEDVSDAPFRQICREKGADIVYTEFISSVILFFIIFLCLLPGRFDIDTPVL